MIKTAATFFLLLASAALSQQTPPPAAQAWWHQTEALANDAMQGRDTGTEAYERAARYVADTFHAAGLKPAGDNGTYFQRVPLHEIDLLEEQSSLTIVTPTGRHVQLKFSQDLATTPRSDFFVKEAPIVFVGYGLPADGLDLKGKIAVFFNSTPAGLAPSERDSFAARRLQALTTAGAVALLAIDNLHATEPAHWPAAYNRSVTVATGTTSAPATTPPVLRLNPDSLGALFAPQDVRVAGLLEHGAKGEALASFATGQSANLRMTTTKKEISSPNIFAILPGSDAKLAPELIALSAHLDGYGFGTPVLGDNLYNGALDDAAYVATLIEMAKTLNARPPARSLLFCIFTGEEKGLLGSQYFTRHPTVPASQIVADLNLDQLRPIFPLRILTMEGLTDSTLGETARGVARSFAIELRPDREPERNLFRRADNYNFVRIGVPIASFIFGYDPHTEEERLYRDWYARRYHKPQDDLATPIDWKAAVTFNNFFQALTLAVANAPGRPAWLPESPYAPKI